MNNTTSLPYQTAQDVIDKYVTIFIIIVGIPGNILSFIIWMQKRMRHSSGYYLAALAVNDLIFLIMAMMFEVHVVWQTANVLSYPLMCELFPVIYLALQALSPCLVLAFTTERYISICHPFKRDTFCTIRRAKMVVVCLTAGCLLLSAINGYFFYLVTSPDGFPDCTVRPSILAGGRFSIFNVYEIARAAVCFLLVPLAILTLNVLVIREMSRLSRFEPTQSQGASSPRTGSTTVMLLSVSFYQIITTLPISVVYAMYFDFQFSPTFNLVFTINKEYGITHYAFNFIIYVITGRMFREELKRLFLRPFGKMTSHFSSEYNSLTTTVHSSVKKTWSSVNGSNNSDRDKSVEPSETLL
ncbi:orphan G-protein coupled receptor 50 [Elysia marginata]|uniref:Orphan G-protein coupled receptor 50 n=1 Tax=Elysia marginata TaxID=1093978 RepID=A0AAV4GEA7_9GAST|nr:orphan G-protein coupled receptor 50 [Elysia marginata]